MGGSSSAAGGMTPPLKPNISLGEGNFAGKTVNFGDTGAGVNFGGNSFKLSGGGNKLTATDINKGTSVTGSRTMDWGKVGTGALSGLMGSLGGISKSQSSSGSFQSSPSYPNAQQTPDAKTIKSGEGAITAPYDDGTLQKFLAWQQANGY